MKEIIASSPGRVCFAGEKLDWLAEGKGITCTLENVLLNVLLQPTNSNIVSVFSKTTKGGLTREDFKLPISNLENSKSYAKAVLLAFRYKGVNIEQGAQINIESKIPQGLGLSSSAALCTAIAGVITKWQNLKIDKGEIAHIAYVAEKEILGIRCGQMDQYAVVFGGLCQINSSIIPAKVIRFEDKFKDYSILIANPGLERKTDSINIGIQQRFKNGDKSIQKYIGETTSIVEFLSVLLQNKNPNINELGKAITQAHFLLSDSLGVSNLLLDNIVRVAINAGAYGAKLGSGKAGVVFAITDNESAGSVREAISSLGLDLITTKIGSHGLDITEKVKQESKYE